MSAGKFHVNTETGNPGPCTAEKIPCRFSGPDEHYGTPEAAAFHYEQKMKSELIPAPASRSESDYLEERRARSREEIRAASKGKWEFTGRSSSNGDGTVTIETEQIGGERKVWTVVPEERFQKLQSTPDFMPRLIGSLAGLSKVDEPASSS